MIGLTLWAIALTVGGAVSDSPGGKPTATSYSIYHRKFEPSDGPTRSVSYSTKIGGKQSGPRGERFSKDGPLSFSKGPGPSKDTGPATFSEGSRFNKDGPNDGPRYSKDGSNYSDDGPRYTKDGPNYSKDEPNYSKDGPNYSKDGPNYSKDRSNYQNDGPRYAKDGSDYTNDGPPPKGYNNDVPAYTKSSSGPPNYSEENYKNEPNYDGPGFTASTPSYPNDVPAYDTAPHPNNPPPVYDAPTYPNDIPYNGSPSYSPSGPAPVPHYDGPPVIPPSSINTGIPSYNVNPGQFSSFQPSHANFPVNLPNVGNFPTHSNVGNYQSYPNVGNLNIPNVGNLNIPNLGNFNYPNVGSFNIPKPSYQLPFINHGGGVPGQFSYPIDRVGSQYSSPLKDHDSKRISIKRESSAAPETLQSGISPTSATSSTTPAGISQSTHYIEAVLPTPKWFNDSRLRLRPTPMMSQVKRTHL